jgi:hypothetical protein
MARQGWLRTCLLFTCIALGGACADDSRERSAVELLTTVPLPAGNHLVVFDISWLDAQTRLYYLADRSDRAVDVVDARTNQFVRQIRAGFKGFTGSNDTSGPNGVVVSGHLLFVTDAPSRVVAIDLRTDTLVGEVSTGGAGGNRADELAWDPADRRILAVNNADSPPFASLIQVNPDGSLKLLQRITFTDATNGAEQPLWDARLGKFFLSIPELNGNTADGAVARISRDGVLETFLHVARCQPAGLTLGPRQDLLLGCSVIFDTAGNAWTASDPLSAAPTQVIMDAASGAIDAVVAGVGGSDEVWFNPGDGRYYTASRSNPAGPVLGVIDADTQRLVQVVPTFNTPGSAPAPRGTAHSVAVDPASGHAIVPLPANNVFPGCLDGCFAIYGVPGDD